MISVEEITTQFQLKVIIFLGNNFQELHLKLTVMKLSKVSDENLASGISPKYHKTYNQ